MCESLVNFAQTFIKGQTGEAITLTDEYSRIATDAANALKLGIAGVDLLQTKNGPVILEVNPSPGFEELESVTKIDIAKVMIEYAGQLAENRSQKGTGN